MKPIKFNQEFIPMILSGSKTQTRRPTKVEACWAWEHDRTEPPWKPGDKLFVQEVYQELFDANDLAFGTEYKGNGICPYERKLMTDEDDNSDGLEVDVFQFGKIGWKRPEEMTAWHSRITLLVNRVWVERVQDISAEDAIAEGISIPRCGCEVCSTGSVICPADRGEFSQEFGRTWDSIYGETKYKYALNCWVWAGEFERVKE